LLQQKLGNKFQDNERLLCNGLTNRQQVIMPSLDY